MRKHISISIILIVLAAATTGHAARITAEDIIAAHRLGATAEAMTDRVLEPTNEVTSPSVADIAAMRDAGVPEAVIQAMTRRSGAAPTSPTPVPQAETAVEPDNPELVDLVRLLESGISESLVADQIRENGVRSRPSINDLIFLKQHAVPETIIVALMEAPVRGSMGAGGTAEPSPTGGPVTIEGLVYKKGGFLVKNRVGQLVLEDDRLTWKDARDSSKNFQLYTEGLEEIDLMCTTKEGSRFCYEIELEFTQGQEFNFQDVDQDVGGNEHVQRLLEVLSTRYPDVRVIRKGD